jgi:hypothetical protein
MTVVQGGPEVTLKTALLTQLGNHRPPKKTFHFDRSRRAAGKADIGVWPDARVSSGIREFLIRRRMVA